MYKSLLVLILSLTLTSSQAQNHNSVDLAKSFLDTIQKKSYLTHTINWDSIRPIFLKKVENIKFDKDLLTELESFLTYLNDGHSSITYIDSDQISEESFYETMMKMTDKKAGLRPKNFKHRMIEGKYAYINIPGLQYEHLAYIDTIGKQLKELDNKNPKAWIIDLTENNGGMNYPMIWHFESLIDVSKTYSYVSNDGSEMKVPKRFKIEGKSDQKTADILGLNPEILPSIKIKNRKVPIIILTSPLTASAGEFFVAYFKGQKNVTILGQKTNGSTTANQTFILDKRLGLNLSVSVLKDRTGKVYDIKEGIKPDINLDLVFKDLKISEELYQSVINYKSDYLNKAIKILDRGQGIR